MKHGLYKSRTYSIWRGIKKRCNLKSHPSYKWYGEKGISYDKKWETFKGFLLDMGICPEGLQIDRIDTTKNYSKDNCHWVNSKTNQNNRINNLMRDEFLLSGKTFGKWKIEKETLGEKKSFGRRFICKCECGKIKIVLSSHLKSGKSTQCRDCGNKQMSTKLNICPKTGRFLSAP